MPALRTLPLLLLLALPWPGPLRSASAEEAASAAPIQGLVDELMPYVASLRGLPWKAPVPAKVLTRAELGTLLTEQLDRDVTPAEWARDTRILRRLGMLREDEDLKELLTSMFQAGVEGLYDPESKRMYVIEGFAGDEAKPTIVHELIHALEDQHLDLDKLEAPYRDHEPDRVFAIRCVFEGGAEYARRRFLDEHPQVAARYYAREQGSEADQQRQIQMMRRVPAHMMVASLLHYRTGPNFVGHALRSDYPTSMGALYADMPTTQEQCLYPHKWLGTTRDHPRTVHWGGDFAAVLGSGWSKLDEHAVGEIDLAVYLDFFLGGRKGRLNLRTLGQGRYVCTMASRAARGWDAGRAYYLEAPDKRLVVIQALAFDSDAEAREAARFVAAALHKSNGKTWQGRGWQGAATEPDGRYFDYVGTHGRGRVAQRGREVLVLDGTQAEAFDRLWTEVAKTTFVQDPRDAGDTLPDPFAGDAVVDRRRGLGLRLPGPHWQAEESDGASPNAFATARSGSVVLEFTVLDQEHAQAGLPVVGRALLGRLWSRQHTRSARVMGRAGLVHGLPAAPGQQAWVYLASDLVRTYVITVRGRAADVERLRPDVTRLLQGVDALGGTPAGTAEAGIRSIPAY